MLKYSSTFWLHPKYKDKRIILLTFTLIQLQCVWVGLEISAVPHLPSLLAVINTEFILRILFLQKFYHRLFISWICFIVWKNLMNQPVTKQPLSTFRHLGSNYFRNCWSIRIFKYYFWVYREWFNTTKTTCHHYIMHEIHSRFVCFGICQFQERWHTEANCTACVAPLQINTGQ